MTDGAVPFVLRVEYERFADHYNQWMVSAEQWTKETNDNVKRMYETLVEQGKELKRQRHWLVGLSGFSFVLFILLLIAIL